MLGHYLLGRQLATRDPELAAKRLAQACPLVGESGAGPEAIFIKECLRLLGETAYLAGDLTTASVAFTNLELRPERPAGDPPNDYYLRTAERLRAQDFLERIAWKVRTSLATPSDDSSGRTSPHDRAQVPPRQ
jgi:hypothetical protein